MTRTLALLLLLLRWPGVMAEPPRVIVADGAGDFRACSNALLQASIAEGQPFDLVTFVWSHGYHRIIDDQTDKHHLRQQGRHLAHFVQHLQQRESKPTFLVGHSAGCAVVLRAAEALPPSSLERIVLLAPAVAADTDWRPAARATRQGIDSFASHRDRWALGVGMILVGTADERASCRAAGRVGFLGADGVSLRESWWSWSDRSLGHNGRHFGVHSPAFLQSRVLPLLRPNPSGLPPR